MRRFFNPTLSFDGVTLIVAVILASIAYGRLWQRVEGIDTVIATQYLEIKNLNSEIGALHVRDVQLEVEIADKLLSLKKQ